MECRRSNNYGISGMIPEVADYFKEELVCDILRVPSQKPDVEHVLDVMIWPEVENLKIIDTPVATSNEGQHLSGMKLIVELKIKEKITYVACEPTQSVHAAHFEMMKSVFVILPEKVGEKYVCDLLRAGRLNVSTYIEGNINRLLNGRNIYQCALLFVNVVLC